MDLRFPIGPFKCDEKITLSQVELWINEIQNLPSNLRSVVGKLDDSQLDVPYRQGGWTIRQVVHHIADSHMNAYIRFKLALTEDNPTIKTYEESSWADLIDSKLSVDISLHLIEFLHMRWVALLSSLTEQDLKKVFTHPDSGLVTIERNIGIYAWHGKHHLAHITSLIETKGW